MRLITASAATAPENHEQVFHLPPQLHLLLYHKLISLTATCRSLYVIFVEGLMRHDETAIFDGTVHIAVEKCSPRTEFPALLIAVTTCVRASTCVNHLCVTHNDSWYNSGPNYLTLLTAAPYQPFRLQRLRVRTRTVKAMAAPSTMFDEIAVDGAIHTETKEEYRSKRICVTFFEP